MAAQSLAASRSTEQLLIRLAYTFAQCSYAKDHAGAKEALKEILRLCPPGQQPPGYGAQTQEEISDFQVVKTAEGTMWGKQFTTSGSVVDLGKELRLDDPENRDAIRFEQVFLRTTSGNLYRIARVNNEDAYSLTCANSTAQYLLPPQFPEGYRLTLGLPFVTDVMKNGSPVVRQSSPITEVLLLCTSGEHEEILSGIKESSTIVEEFVDKAGVSHEVENNSHVPVIVNQGSQIGYQFKKLAFKDVLSESAYLEGVSNISHIYIRTKSGNIYRIEKDAPDIGMIKIIDLRNSVKSGKIVEHGLLSFTLKEVAIEAGASLKLAGFNTSAILEIVLVNGENHYSPRELAELVEGTPNSIVDDFNREIKNALDV